MANPAIELWETAIQKIKSGPPQLVDFSKTGRGLEEKLGRGSAAAAWCRNLKNISVKRVKYDSLSDGGKDL